MAVKGGLGRGLGSKGRGIDSIISPTARTRAKDSRAKTNANNKETFNRKSDDDKNQLETSQTNGTEWSSEKSNKTGNTDAQAVTELPNTKTKKTKQNSAEAGNTVTKSKTSSSEESKTNSKSKASSNGESKAGSKSKTSSSGKTNSKGKTTSKEDFAKSENAKTDISLDAEVNPLEDYNVVLFDGESSKKENQKDVLKGAETFVKVADIEPNRQQPRKNFDEDALLELADSIRQYGVLSPILLQKNGEYYEIIAGERRWRAAKLAGLREVPAIIREYSKQEVMEIALIENIQRENLNPIEEAVAFKQLLEEFGLKQDELAERVSKSRTAVTNAMRLLKLDTRVQRMLIDEMISSGHARALLAVEDGEVQYALAQQVFDEKLSVRDIEKLVRNLGKEKKSSAKQQTDPALQLIYQELEQRMTGVIGTKVTIHHKNQKNGKIEISYHSNEELERLTEMLLSLHNH